MFLDGDVHVLHTGNESGLQSFFEATCKSSYSVHNDCNVLRYDFVKWLINDSNKIDCISIINWYSIIDHVELATKLNNGCLEKGWNLLSILASLCLKHDVIVIREDLHDKISLIVDVIFAQN